jgi:hypothetical protein
VKRILCSILLLAAATVLALPAAAADLDAPVCSDAAALSRAAAPAENPAAGEIAPANDLEVAEPLALGGPIGPIPPQQCGLVTCPVGTTCCNPLCSACTPPGVSCTMGDCGHGSTS